jgi:hypothetical protein
MTQISGKSCTSEKGIGVDADKLPVVKNVTL